MTPTPGDARIRRYLTRWPTGDGDLEIHPPPRRVRRRRDRGRAATPTPSFSCHPRPWPFSSRYLAELIVGPAPSPASLPAGTPAPNGAESVLGPDPATVAAEALEGRP